MTGNKRKTVPVLSDDDCRFEKALTGMPHTEIQRVLDLVNLEDMKFNAAVDKVKAERKRS